MCTRKAYIRENITFVEISVCIFVCSRIIQNPLHEIGFGFHSWDIVGTWLGHTETR